MSQTQELVAAGHGVADIEPNTHSCVRQNRAVFYHRAAIDTAVSLDVAASRNQSILLDFRTATDISRSNNPCGAVDLGFFIDPNARLDFTSRGTQCAAAGERIRNQPP